MVFPLRHSLILYAVDKQSYVVTVAPGVDAALLMAICICLVSSVLYYKEHV